MDFQANEEGCVWKVVENVTEVGAALARFFEGLAEPQLP